MDINYRTVTREAGEFRVTVRETVGMDEIDCSVIYRALDYDRTSPQALRRAEAFANAVMRTVDVSGLPFEWVSLSSSSDELQRAFENYQSLKSPVIVRLWQNALIAADEDPTGEA